MTTHMAKHFQKKRVEACLSLAQLARMIGYRNVSKGFRKIDTFERTGHVHPVLLDKLAAALGIDRRTRSRLAYEDYKTWLRTSANPPTPYMIQRPYRGCIAVPAGLKTVEELEQYAARYAVESGAAVTIVLDNRIRVTFSEDGTLQGISEAVPTENPT